MTAVVRRAHADELPAIAELRWRWIHDKRVDAEALPTRADFTAVFVEWARQQADSHTAFVAVRNGEVVGMAWLAVAQRVPSPRASGRRSGDLQSCYVVPEHRREGIGRALVHAVLNHARELGLEHVTVHASLESVNLYQRSGFRDNPRSLWADAAVLERD